VKKLPHSLNNAPTKITNCTDVLSIVKLVVFIIVWFKKISIPIKCQQKFHEGAGVQSQKGENEAYLSKQELLLEGWGVGWSGTAHCTFVVNNYS